MEGASSQSHSISASKQYTVLYYNARTILPNLDELQANVLLQKPDIIGVSLAIKWKTFTKAFAPSHSIFGSIRMQIF